MGWKREGGSCEDVIGWDWLAAPREGDVPDEVDGGLT